LPILASEKVRYVGNFFLDDFSRTFNCCQYALSKKLKKFEDLKVHIVGNPTKSRLLMIVCLSLKICCLEFFLKKP